MAGETVIGTSGQNYHCPDVAAVDRHIAKRHGDLAKVLPPRTAGYDVRIRLRQVVLDDVDLLLERRHALTCGQVPA